MDKGELKKLAILEAGLEMASQVGLEGLSIGSLAKVTRMSKSGLFAHFQSKENLQIAILRYAGELFAENIIIPALMTEAGIPRIRTLVSCWVDWTSRMTKGCIFVNASTEFSERPGKVRDIVLHQQEQWVDCLSRIAQSAIRAGAFRADIDCNQFTFDLYSLLLGFHYYDRLLNDPHTRKRQEEALDRLLANYCRPASG